MEQFHAPKQVATARRNSIFRAQQSEFALLQPVGGLSRFHFENLKILNLNDGASDPQTTRWIFMRCWSCKNATGLFLTLRSETKVNHFSGRSNHWNVHTITWLVKLDNFQELSSSKLKYSTQICYGGMNPATEFDAEPNRLLPSRIFSIYGSKKRELIALQCRWSACNLMKPFKVASRCQVTENDIIGHLRISDTTSDTARRRRRVAS